jgi:hypothetical protein
MTALTPEQQQQIEAACKRLVLEAVNCTDQQDYAGLATLFLPDGVLYRPTAPESPLERRASIQASYQGRPANRITRHCCSNFRVTVESSGRARDGRLILGEFDDLCVAAADGWQIAERRASFVMHRDL